MSDTRPIYLQIAAGIREQIAAGTLPEGERAPSTNELSAFHSVNPTTSAKALTWLFEQGLLEKRRGLGMFVLPGAREQIQGERREALAADFIRPLLKEARALDLGDAELDALIEAERTRA
ncbi:HTH-type transcriptional repressor YtrA [Corynebacterium occultum]|uniref:HTH-type transcriptional repressor YtrA n=1 Tax=Corynebacterium occultum TaxID=2675219 RepID=A0A6B8W959_9CORY|nr:GntR family transcriptional regulator [Corynebacterium occultum]QGU06540.1 HTH-type transcriptional repressor YtrA [Corynebacterium occultum]